MFIYIINVNEMWFNFKEAYKYSHKLYLFTKTIAEFHFIRNKLVYLFIAYLTPPFMIKTRAIKMQNKTKKKLQELFLTS